MVPFSSLYYIETQIKLRNKLHGNEGLIANIFLPDLFYGYVMDK